MTTITINSAKGSTTGTITECAAWMAEYQPSFPAVEVDGESEDIGGEDWTVESAEEEITSAIVRVLLSACSDLNHGDGCLGIIIREAIRNGDATEARIREIEAEQVADAAAEREADDA